MWNLRITKNFNACEFTTLEEHELSAIKKFMLKSLVTNILQPIRDHLNSAFIGDSVSMVITSGIRTVEHNKNLTERGYNPSPISDHLFGEPVEIPQNRIDLISTFGKYYSYSVGAVDFIPYRVNCLKAFSLIATDLVGTGKIDVGQLIFENTKDGKEWIHVSNPVELIYAKNVIPRRGHKILTTNDGGLTYKRWSQT